MEQRYETPLNFEAMRTAATHRLQFIERLKGIYQAEEASTLWEWMLEDLLGINKMQQRMTPDWIPDASQVSQIERTLMRMLQHEPIQYITGKAHFMGHIFHVTPEVLIPRQETEELVEEIIKKLENEQNSPLEIFDVCTGSGCIALALAYRFPNFKLNAIDLSEGALEVAIQNELQLLGKSVVKWMQGNILNPDIAAHLPPMDAIISNPPYVTPREQSTIKAGVLDWEPHLALFVPEEDPLLFYKACLQLALQKLKPRGYLAFEINEQMGPEMLKLFRGMPFENIYIKKDLNGKDRMLLAQRIG